MFRPFLNIIRAEVIAVGDRVMPPTSTDFAAIKTMAMTQGALPRLIQSWTVPRCTSTSPAFR
jgi:hypothetical protein